MEKEDYDEPIEQKLARLKEEAIKFLNSVGKEPTEIYRIEKFVPTKVDPQFHGKFYQGDSYVVVRRKESEKKGLEYDIHYWHGKEASMVRSLSLAPLTLTFSPCSF